MEAATDAGGVTTDDATATSTGDALRQVMRTYPAGVVIVTAASDDGPVGMAASSFVSVSLEPPLVLFCAAKASGTWPAIRDSGAFVANVISAESQWLCERFAARGVDRFADVGHTPGVTGAPVLDDATAFVECTIEQIHDAGDHEIAIGAVTAAEVRDTAEPLVYADGAYRRLVSEDT